MYALAGAAVSVDGQLRISSDSAPGISRFRDGRERPLAVPRIASRRAPPIVAKVFLIMLSSLFARFIQGSNFRELAFPSIQSAAFKYNWLRIAGRGIRTQSRNHRIYRRVTQNAIALQDITKG